MRSGGCVELKALGSRIILDVGKPLWADWGETVPLPAVRPGWRTVPIRRWLAWTYIRKIWAAQPTRGMRGLSSISLPSSP